ncbi:MAG: hypothetical protein A2W31_11385 [Planctomycetes bacterium RBG_16_64_10]|nr:MAG: hypothetical protein A2W31_11385 [Planctomycetes bacterium RBG_16_64_10]
MTGPYLVADSNTQSVRYTLGTGPVAELAPPLKQITERQFGDSRAARRALLRGEIDAIDRVVPWDVAALESADGITVATYALPTVHVLIPNPRKPLTASRHFRRALCYGIHRQAILDEVILRGRSRPGFVVLSGPFPVGQSIDDPIGAAVDRRIAPYPYEPRLALILATVALREMAAAGAAQPAADATPAAKSDSAAGVTPPLVLAYRAEPLARLACEAIQAHLEIVDIPVTLKPLTAGDLADPLGTADLLYAELAMWEPLVDAQQLLGDGGLAGSTSAYMQLALRQVAEAQNWNELWDALRSVHRVAHDEVAVIPLWQTYNDLAYRSTLQGVGQQPVTLYQNVQRWTNSAPRGN